MVRSNPNLEQAKNFLFSEKTVGYSPWYFEKHAKIDF